MTNIDIKIADISMRLILQEGFRQEVESAARWFKSEKGAECILRANIVEDKE